MKSYLIFLTFFILISGAIAKGPYYKAIILLNENSCSNCNILPINGIADSFAEIIDTSNFTFVYECSDCNTKYLKNSLTYPYVTVDTTKFYRKRFGLKGEFPAVIYIGNDRIVLKTMDYRKPEFQNLLNDFKQKLKYESLQNVSTVQLNTNENYELGKAWNPILIQDTLFVVDNLTNTIKSFNKNSGDFVREIAANDSIKYYFIKDDLKSYESLIKRKYPFCQFQSLVPIDDYRSIGGILKLMTGIKYDTVTSISKDLKDTTIHNIKLYTPRDFLFKISSNNEIVVDHSNSDQFDFSLSSRQLLDGQYFAKITYPKKIQMRELKTGKYYTSMVSRDFNFEKSSCLLSYKDIINHFNLDTINIFTSGAWAAHGAYKLYFNNYYGSFVSYKGDEKKFITPDGMLPSTIHGEFEVITDSVFFYFDDIFYHDKSFYVLIQPMNQENYAINFILQKYSLDGNFEKEIYIDLGQDKLFDIKYVTNINNDIVLLLKTKNLRWSLLKLNL